MIYVSEDTLLHRLDARVKIVILFVFSVALFSIDSLPLMIAATGFVSGAALLAHLPVRTMVVPLIPVLFLAVFSAIFAFVSEPGLAGILRGSVIALRMIVLVAASMVVCLTTTSTRLVQGFAKLISPLARLGVPTADAAFTLSLALRFIPVITWEFSTIRKAQISRGGEGMRLPFRRKLEIYGSAFSAVFIGLFRHAAALGDALDSRCYGFQQGQR